MEPTAYGRGSTISLTPYFRAAITPAPNAIPPCVTVGPSSTTSARRPVSKDGSSTCTGDAASIITALGFTRATLARTLVTSCGGAVSTSCITATTALPPFRPPGGDGRYCAG